MTVWQPRLDRSSPSATRLAAHTGATPVDVIGILDPPKHALPAAAYQTAQQNTARLFEQIPADEPFIIGLQEEFWSESDRLARSGTFQSSGYLQGNGLGIAQAVVTSGRLSDVVRLESATQVAAFKSLESRAIDVMTFAAAFFDEITKAFRTLERTAVSRDLADFVRTTEQWSAHPSGPDRSSGGLTEYLPAALQAARAAGVDLTTSSYRALILLERIVALEKVVKAGNTEGEMNELAAKITGVAERANFPARAAWELRTYALAREAAETEEIAAERDAISQRQAEQVVPDAPDDVVRAARSLVRQRCLVGMRQVDEREDKAAQLGDHGDMVSNLRELGAVVGIDLTEFPRLAEYVYYSANNGRLASLVPGRASGAAALDGLKRLSKDVMGRLARTSQEREIVALRRVAAFLEFLSRYQLPHDEQLRAILSAFNTVQFCEALSRLGAALRPGWQAQAQAIDERLGTLRDFYDLTILRGKDLAANLLSSMTTRGVRRGVICCDGFLNETLTRTFNSRDVSWSLYIPKFPTR